MAVFRNAVKSAAVIVVLVGVAWATVRAQQGIPSSAGSLAELTAEVRQLRVAVQEGGKTQTQMQALAIALTAQQARLAQVSARLDKSEEDLQAASKRTQEMMKMAAEFQASLGRSLTTEERTQYQRNLEIAKAEAAPLLEEENRLRQRQQEIMAAFRADEARWLELVARLDEIIKR